MVNQNKYYIITFESTYHSIKAENYLRENMISYRMIPIPSVITADCGSGIRIDDDIDEVKKIFLKSGIQFSAVYEVRLDDKDKEYHKL